MKGASVMRGKRGIAVVAVVVVVGALLALYVVSRPNVNQGSKAITVEVVHSDERTAAFTYETNRDYLGQLLLEEGLIEGETDSYGLYVTTVDGERAVFQEDNAYWALYENGDYASTGVDTTPITDGYTYRWVYTQG